MTVEALIHALMPSLIVSIVMLIFTRRLNRQDADGKRRDDRHTRSERLQVALLVAAAKLSQACAIALRDGKTNGEMKDALQEYKKAMEAFRDFERDLIANSD